MASKWFAWRIAKSSNKTWPWKELHQSCHFVSESNKQLLSNKEHKIAPPKRCWQIMSSWLWEFCEWMRWRQRQRQRREPKLGGDSFVRQQPFSFQSNSLTGGHVSTWHFSNVFAFVEVHLNCSKIVKGGFKFQRQFDLTTSLSDLTFVVGNDQMLFCQSPSCNDLCTFGINSWKGNI